MKITHVKVCNYRNLRNIDIGLAETVAIIGENNSGIYACFHIATMRYYLIILMKMVSLIVMGKWIALW